MKLRKILKTGILILIIGVFNTVDGQTKISITSDARFMGNIKGEHHNDPTGMLKDFTVGIQWWTLVGEPVESYNILWNSSGYYKVKLNGKTQIISKNLLAKYPDLLKQFNAIEPSKIDVVIYGKANGKSSAIKRGGVHSQSQFYKQVGTYKKNGQAFDRYTLSAPVVYVIKDASFLTTKSGRMGRSLSPESPKSWNYFLSWKQNTSSFSSPNKKFDYLVHNKSDFDFKKMNHNAQGVLNTEFKSLFLNATSFSLKAEILTLKWPLFEMESLAKEYLRRENGGDYVVKATKPDMTNDWGDFKEEKIMQNVYIFVVAEESSWNRSIGELNLTLWVSPIVSVKVPKSNWPLINENTFYYFYYGMGYYHERGGYWEGREAWHVKYKWTQLIYSENSWLDSDDYSIMTDIRLIKNRARGDLNYGSGTWGTLEEVKKQRQKYIRDYKENNRHRQVTIHESKNKVFKYTPSNELKKKVQEKMDAMN